MPPWPKSWQTSRVPAVRAGQRPVLTWNDPLKIFGNQREQTLLVAAADRCKKILHNLDILLSAHKNFSIPRIDRVRSTRWLGPATGLLKTQARIARKHGRWIAVADAADEVRLDSRTREKGLIYAGVVEARHRAAVQSQRPRSDDEVSALQRSVSHGRHLSHAWCREVLLHHLGRVRHKLC